MTNRENFDRLVIPLCGEEVINNVRASLHDCAVELVRASMNEKGFNAEYIGSIIVSCQQSIVRFDARLKGAWFAALVAVGSDGDVQMLTDVASRRVSVPRTFSAYFNVDIRN